VAASEANPEGREVLLVEDDPDTLASLTVVLEGEGWRVHEAATIATGLAALKQHRLDAVVTDERLPDGKGSVFLRLVAALQPDARRVLYTAQEPDVAGLYRLVRKPSVDRLIASLG
jgi:DNA-binding NtrC family response regulator